jgi:hypothetical protein
MTIDNMFKTMSKFFEDPKNKAFISADKNSWWYAHVFTEMIFEDGKGTKRVYLTRVLDGPFGDEIKPLVKYVMTGGTPTELFPTKGSGYTPVMTVLGLQKFLARLPKNKLSAQIREIADQSLALWIAGDETFIEGARANAASSAPIPQLYREAIASERAAGGASIAPPLNNKRKPDEDNEIYDWKKDPRAYNVLVTQFQKNNDEIANAEVKKIEKVGDAEAAGKKSVADAQVNAIELDTAGKKNVADAEADRIKAQTALLQFELQQKQNAAGNATDATQANEPPHPAAGPSLAQRIVQLAPLFFARSNTGAAAASAAPTPAKDKAPPAATHTRKSRSGAKQTPSPAKENAPPKANNSKQSTKQSLLYAKDQNPNVMGAGDKQRSTAPIMQFFISRTPHA